MVSKSPWIPLSERVPPSNCPALIVTNMLGARDNFGHHSHIWLVVMVHKQPDGSFQAFAADDTKILRLTHWRYAIPEDADQLPRYYCRPCNRPFTSKEKLRKHYIEVGEGVPGGLK